MKGLLRRGRRWWALAGGGAARLTFDTAVLMYHRFTEEPSPSGISRRNFAAQLDWLADRLGPAAFANPTLAFYRGKALGYTERGVKSESDVPLRQDRMAIQCPRCRRQTAWAA